MLPFTTKVKTPLCHATFVFSNNASIISVLQTVSPRHRCHLCLAANCHPQKSRLSNCSNSSSNSSRRRRRVRRRRRCSSSKWPLGTKVFAEWPTPSTSRILDATVRTEIVCQSWDLTWFLRFRLDLSYTPLKSYLSCVLGSSRVAHMRVSAFVIPRQNVCPYVRAPVCSKRPSSI